MHHPDEHGAVTAEAAVVLPVMALVAIALAWMLMVGITEVRAVDAARETARSAARSDDLGTAMGLGRRVAPQGSQISVSTEGSAMVAHVTSPVRGPGRLLGRLASFSVHATAVAAQEPTS